ncbi:MAG TPA: ComEC/Rec2 family competence protein [Armatimonadota bacterium]|nr:ComEC/Rec2 family competence protein [Armatimonadota bacterium]
MNLHHRPLFPFAITYIAGLVCAGELRSHPFAGIGIAAGVFLGACVLSARISHRSVVGLLAAVFVLGFIRTAAYWRIPPSDISQYAEGKLVYLTGDVASDPEPLGDSIRFTVQSRTVRTYAGEYAVPGRVMVTLYTPRDESKAADAPFYGETVRIHGRLRTPQPLTNPGRAADYGEYLAHKRVYCTLSGGMDQTSVVQPAPRSVRWAASRFKAHLTKEALELFRPVHARLLLGILLGNYASLPLDVQAAFMKSGTMHLLAASGYNCGVIVGIFAYLMRRLTTPRAAMHWLLIALLWGFTLIAGPGPSIVRAAVMVTTFLAAFLLWRAPDMVNIVLFAGLLILGVNPLSLYDVGFQLSFAAVLGIVLILPLIEPKASEWLAPTWNHAQKPPGRIARWTLWASRSIVVAVLLSIVAAVATWPITAYYFNYVSSVCIIANALTALLVLFLSAAGIAALFLGSIWGVLGHAAAVPGTILAVTMLGVVTELGSHPWSSFSVRSPSPVFIAVYYLVLLGVLEYAHRQAARTQRAPGDS